MDKIDFSMIRKLEDRLAKSQLTEEEKAILRTQRKVLTHSSWPGGTGKWCFPGYESCPRCGQVALFEQFLRNNKCPNPNCLDRCFGLGPTWTRIGIFDVLLNRIVQAITCH